MSSFEFSFDTMVVKQYYDACRPSVRSEGEHRLMLAVLKTAICDYLQDSESQTRETRRLSDEAGAWISRKSPTSGVFAYEEVCESLGIEPGRLRKRLALMANRSMDARLQSLPVRPADQMLRAARPA
jgi:hypothetical protein